MIGWSYQAFATSPLGWLQIPAALMVGFGVCGVLEARDARRAASMAAHPTARRPYDWEANGD